VARGDTVAAQLFRGVVYQAAAEHAAVVAGRMGGLLVYLVQGLAEFFFKGEDFVLDP